LITLDTPLAMLSLFVPDAIAILFRDKSSSRLCRVNTLLMWTCTSSCTRA